jgi:putative PIN family toxin of toxin-antitoxin system
LTLRPAIVAEVRAFLHYPRIHNKFPPSGAEIEQLIVLLEHDTMLVAGDSGVIRSVLSDPKDEMFLTCALEGQADFIVGGDRHLLDLVEWFGGSKSRAFRAPFGLGNDRDRDFGERRASEVVKPKWKCNEKSHGAMPALPVRAG